MSILKRLSIRYVFIAFHFLTLNLFAQNPSITIGIQPFTGFDKKFIDTLSLSIKQVYGCKVMILPEKVLPKSAFINIKSPRYKADSLLLFLKKNKPLSVKCVIGLTGKDISTTDYDQKGKIKQPEWKYKDWGIFGLGYCPGPSCVVSTFRLKNTNKANFILRFKKVCIHELGHNLGLPHCTTPKCVMGDACETIKTVDNEKLELCGKCKNKIKY
jgi:archaemetzincin